MKAFAISFYRTSDAEHMSVQFRAQEITKQAIENALRKNRKEINTWLLFGETDVVITSIADGNVVAKGKYEYNAFASGGSYDIKMI